ncbi:unnamed protein product [Dicrocoelium dendriticum]|nr:unnamed protein product [Dicrocoelium dendriticum]
MSLPERTLCGKVFYKDQDKIYCEEDYLYCGFQQTAEKCHNCGHLIYETVSSLTTGMKYTVIHSLALTQTNIFIQGTTYF